MIRLPILILFGLLSSWSFSGALLFGVVNQFASCHLAQVFEYADQIKVMRWAGLTQVRTQEKDASASIDKTIASLFGDDAQAAQIYLLGATLILLLIFIYLYTQFRSSRRLNVISKNPGYSGGELFLDSEPGVGENEDVVPSFSPNYISTELAPTILVAEENDELRVFITNTLRLNYRVIAVQDGLKAFRKAYDTVPDLVITNSLMPGMDGVSLCHVLKSTMATSHIQVILLNTDPANQPDLPEGSLPADGCLKADFDAKTLLIEIRNLIAHRRAIFTAFRKQLVTGQSVESYFNVEKAFIDKVNNVLRGGYKNPRFGVEDLADGLSMTKLQLFRKLKTISNKTPGDYIRYFRIKEAGRLLNQKNSRVSDVATAVGFSNLTAFTKAFKDVTGSSPVAYSEQTNSVSSSHS